MFSCPVCCNETLEAAPYEVWPPPGNLVISPPYEDFLGRPSYEVCPRCGFEFGNDDNPGTGDGVSFEEYRRGWEAEGKPWFDRRAPREEPHTAKRRGRTPRD